MTPRTTLFADETKSRGYVMVAAAIEPSAVAGARRDLRRLLMRGQTSVHFRSESDARRKEILDVISDQGWGAHVVVARPKNQRDARDACLRRIVALAAELGSTGLVLETDDSLVAQDRRLLFDATRRHGLSDGFAYRHLRRREEPCLWVPDAVAWCYARGGDWRARADHLLTEVSEVP